MAKRIGFTLLQLVVTAACIYYVFHEPQKRAEIGHALRGADWRWLALSGRFMARCKRSRPCAGRSFSGSKEL